MESKLWVIEVAPNYITLPEKVFIVAKSRYNALSFYKQDAPRWVHILGIRRATEAEERAWPMRIM